MKPRTTHEWLLFHAARPTLQRIHVPSASLGEGDKTSIRPELTPPKNNGLLSVDKVCDTLVSSFGSSCPWIALDSHWTPNSSTPPLLQRVMPCFSSRRARNKNQHGWASHDDR